MEPKVILIQGPPGSGKDAFGKLLAPLVRGAKVMKFAKILKDRTHALYGLFDKYGFLSHDAYDDVKDQPHADFHGLTPRQAYIEVAERHFKRLHGHRIFGDMLLAGMKKVDEKCYVEHTKHGQVDARIRVNDEPVFIVTDSGFRDEAQVLADHFGPERLIVFQVFRDGKTFDGDSRSYWQFDTAYHVYNNGTLEDLAVVAQSNAQFFFPNNGEIVHEPSSCSGPFRPPSGR